MVLEGTDSAIMVVRDGQNLGKNDLNTNPNAFMKKSFKSRFESFKVNEFFFRSIKVFRNGHKPGKKVSINSKFSTLYNNSEATKGNSQATKRFDILKLYLI